MFFMFFPHTPKVMYRTLQPILLLCPAERESFSTGGHRWRAPGGKSDMLAAVVAQPVPPSDVELERLVLDGYEHFILEP